MDGRRFDDLARAVASAGSRRTMLRGIAGGAAAVFGLGRLGRADAQSLVPLGGQCSAFGANGECDQAGTPSGGVPAICSDNGVSRDGGFNCCRNAGGVCSADFHCCGAALCANGVCGGTASGGNLSLGAACTASSQCSQTGGSTVCADNGVAADGALNCCRNAGGACVNGAGCCAALDCVNGVCGGAPTTGGLALGASCTEAAQCSQAGGAVVCADNGISTDCSSNCCRNAGGACTDANNSAACCGGLYCVSGVCTDLAPSGQLPLGSYCTASSQCSQTGGAAVCADNGASTDGTLNCCRNAGGACSSTTSCCGGLVCAGGVCSGGGSTGGGLALGASCTSSSQCSQGGGVVVCADNGLPGDGGLNCCRNAGGACTGANNSAACCGGLLCVNGTCQ
ncbi:MAG: hypothetical protein M3Q10_10275 [Chloroflexota bacterium]|nr:hypothetical protein [Chloroflexota bacterium]